MLQVKNLSFRYGAKEILDEISFCLRQGEIAAILGPSGCGKTTLFQLIAGLLPSEKEAILVQGLSPVRARPFMTYMMQKDLLLPWKKVMDNLLVLANLVTDLSKKELKEKAHHLLKEVGLEGSEHLFPHQLSGGMRQRVALARSLLLERPLLLLDEPFSRVDAAQRDELHVLLKKVQREHKLTILFITHDVCEAYKLADSVFFLEQGKLLSKKTTKNLETPKAFDPFFLPSAQTELVCGGK